MIWTGLGAVLVVEGGRVRFLGAPTKGVKLESGLEERRVEVRGAVVVVVVWWWCCDQR